MVSLESLKNKQEKIAIVGLGYVGLPLAVLLANHFDTIGLDINQKRIDELKQGIDVTKEVDLEKLSSSTIIYTANPEDISKAKFIIIAVPTPIDDNKTPDLSILKKATQMVGKHMTAGSIIVYESTVYPGATEEVCVPILKEESGLVYGTDFAVGYSPERVNPGDKEHTIDKIVKVVAASDEQNIKTISGVYGTITNIHEAPSIRVAEAAKVIENTQRDLNIALMNELATLFYKMDISIYDVLDAAGTKWNFLPFKPGLVGGHCIGVDPYYLTHKAQEIGHDPKLILAGRGINDSLHTFIADSLIEKLKQSGKDPKSCQAVFWGITFKENIPDIRNSKVVDLYNALKNAGIEVVIADPLADKDEVNHEYSITLTEEEKLPKADLLIAAVAHDQYRSKTASDIKSSLKDENSILADIKQIYSKYDMINQGINYWSL